MKHKQILVTTATFLIISSSLIMATPAFAQSTDNSSNPSFFSGIIQFFEHMFHMGGNPTPANTNPNPSGAPTGSGNGGGGRRFGGGNASGSANLQNREKTKLDGLVSQGKITPAQEQAILTELQTVRSQTSPQAMQGMTPTQRQQNFQTMQSTLTTWAQSQGIDPSYVVQTFPQGSGGPRGRGGRGGYGPIPSSSPAM